MPGPLRVLLAGVPRELQVALAASAPPGLLALPVAGLALDDEEPADLCPLLRRVARGGVAVGPRLLRCLAGGLPADVLTRRERQVLALLGLGWANPRIAAALDLGEQTVRNHTSRIYARLGVASRAEAMLWAAAYRRPGRR